MSICLVLELEIRFLATAIVPLLSSFMMVGDLALSVMSDNSLLSHTASCTAIPSATYSALVHVVDNATTGCLLLVQLSAHPDIKNKCKRVRLPPIRQDYQPTSARASTTIFTKSHVIYMNINHISHE